MALIAGRVSTWDIVTVVAVDGGEGASVASMASIVVAEQMMASRRIAVGVSMSSSIFGFALLYPSYRTTTATVGNEPGGKCRQGWGLFSSGGFLAP